MRRGGGTTRQLLEAIVLGRETVHRYDELNRRIETIEPEWTFGKPRITQSFYDGNGNLIRTVLKNEPVDQVRRPRIRQFESFSQSVAGTPVGGASPPSAAAHEEAIESVLAALERLSADHQRVLELRDFDGLPFAEVAERMGRSEPAVRKLASRARARLAMLLA